MRREGFFPNAMHVGRNLQYARVHELSRVHDEHSLDHQPTHGWPLTSVAYVRAAVDMCH